MSSYRSRVALGAALVIAAAVLALVSVHVAPRPYSAVPAGSAPPTRPHPSSTTSPAAPSAAPTSTRKVPEVSGIAWLDIVVVVAVGFVVLVSLGGMLAFLISALRRLGWVRGPAQRRAPAVAPAARPVERDEPDPVAAAVEAGLAELTGGEPDDAIIACWVRLSEAARDAGVEDRRSDTPQDFVTRVAATGRVTPDAVDRLAALYREARFSNHAMTEDDRRAARAALETVRAELRGDVHA